jgi:gluconolactonase
MASTPITKEIAPSRRFDSHGTLIGKILIPEIVANVTFGGAKLNRLFICGTTSLYAIYLTANGSKLG